MTICQHISINRATYGAMSTCSNCKLPIIFNGTQWRWLQEYDIRKIRKMKQAYDIDRLTGKVQS